MTPTTPTPEVFAGPLGAQLLRRVRQASADARLLLAVPIASPAKRADVTGGADRAGDPGLSGNADLDGMRTLIVALTERLASDGARDAGSIAQEQVAALERLRQRFAVRFDVLARVQAAIAELREITSPDAMLARAPAALCDGSPLRRAILSLVRGGPMVPEAAHFSRDAGGARTVLERLRANPPGLEHSLVETELLRRRRATIVVDAQVRGRANDAMAEVTGWTSYVAAPLVIGSHVIGVIHADRGGEEPLDVLDRDVLWEFASGLAQAYESAGMRRTLRHEREQMREFLEWVGARSGELTDAPVTLAVGQRTPLSPSGRSDEDALPPEGRDDRIVFEGLLTRRELDVLRLLAEGHANKAIADALVISGGTVKFHVNSILRKLRVANRAEAVSRYLRLLGMPPP
jgi:LuxR family transcriptional regulator, regulator of acetate metabolism